MVNHQHAILQFFRVFLVDFNSNFVDSVYYTSYTKNNLQILFYVVKFTTNLDKNSLLLKKPPLVESVLELLELPNVLGR